MSTRNIFWVGKGGQCVGLTTLTIFKCRLSLNLCTSTSWNPQVPVQACSGIALTLHYLVRHPVTQLVEVMRYKPDGCGFDSRLYHWNFHWHNPSGRTVAPGLNHPLTEISTSNIFWVGKDGQCVGLTTLTIFKCRLSLNLGASKSWNPQVAVQTCSRIALPLNYLVFTSCHKRTLLVEQPLIS
jgi:hypothetical protein